MTFAHAEVVKLIASAVRKVPNNTIHEDSQGRAAVAQA